MELFIFISRNVASISFFASRPFLTALGIALFGRLGFETGNGAVSSRMQLGNLDLIALGSSNGMPWIMSNLALGIFALLALLEFGASMNTDLRYWYNQSLGILQPGSAFVVTYSYADYEFSYFLVALRSLLPNDLLVVVGQGGARLADGAGPLLDLAALAAPGGWLQTLGAVLWALLMALGAWLAGRLRAGAVAVVDLLDEDNNLGLQSLLQWGETGWAAVGAYVVIFAPIIGLAMAAITVITLFAMRAYFDRREKRLQVPCAVCSTLVHPSAPSCPNCHQPREAPRQVGLFGQAKNAVVANLTRHRLQLIARKRCPTCATRLPAHTVQQACSACGTVTFADPAAANTYLRALSRELPKTLAICFVLGLIPIIGVVPGIVYYRLSLIAGLRGYIPRATGCLTRWGIRLAALILLSLQWIPVVGACMLPLMCLLNYSVYRAVLLRGVGALAPPASIPPVTTPLMAASAPAAPVTIVLNAPATMNDQPATSRDCPNCQRPQPLNYRFCADCGYDLQVAG